MNHLSYHEGEVAVQARVGVGSDGLCAEEMYHPAMGAGVQRFLATQQISVLSSMDADGRMWASLRSGPLGFLHPVDQQTVEIGGYSHPDDPVLQDLKRQSPAGMLVINLAARHRVRLNGVAQVEATGGIRLVVNQVYGNCPQYIQARAVKGQGALSSLPSHRAKQLDEKLRSWVEGSDTLFLATAHPESGLDASHRGGKPGFVRCEDERHLIFPDYSGNNMFNSLGNISSYPKAGLLFPDFDSGAGLQLSGTAKVLWDDPRIAEFPGARRLVALEIERVLELPQATLLEFEFQSYSPHLR
ncbi:MAG: pyridoxamine 5'-phosphate oxidase family protein [Acidobacteriia bacterium]|nr:pyridoxamine 5'-phosphate oxidase family protein [Terriglobia bacterium]